MEIREIPIGAIDRSDRLRKVDPDFAGMIAASFAVHGQRTPIEVRPVEGGRFRLIAGAHRVDAAEQLGWATIKAVEKAVDDLTATLLEIDENLMRHELTALDRAIFLARRKVTYDLLHPEAAKRGRRKGIGLKFSPIKSFAEDVAERLKISGKAVDLAVRRFNKLSPNVRDRLSGTRIAAKGVWLDQIARLQHDRQIAVVEEMLRQGGAETPALAIQRLFPKLPRPPAAQLPRLTRAWELANAEEREAFVLWLRKNGGLPSRGKGA